eukprot:5658077-Amphidinium_carterae.1
MVAAMTTMMTTLTMVMVVIEEVNHLVHGTMATTLGMDNSDPDNWLWSEPLLMEMILDVIHRAFCAVLIFSVRP